MRKDVLIAGAAVVEGLAAWFLDGIPGFLVTWIAACTGTVALAYATRSRTLLGKRPDGTMPLWSYAVFWPWHLFARSTALCNRHGTPESAVHRVHDGWYIGGWPKPGDVPPGTAVLDMTCELPRRLDGPYHCVPTWDGTAPEPGAFSAGIAWALEQRRDGIPVLVHCAHGRGRCATALVAALVRAGVDDTTDRAYARVRAARAVRINRAQRAFLDGWTATNS